jgi:hypothetical protein
MLCVMKEIYIEILLHHNTNRSRQAAGFSRCFGSRSRDILEDLIHQFARQRGTLSISVTSHFLGNRVRLISHEINSRNKTKL